MTELTQHITLHKAFRHKNTLALYILNKPIQATFFKIQDGKISLIIGKPNIPVPVRPYKQFYKIDVNSDQTLLNILIV